MKKEERYDPAFINRFEKQIFKYDRIISKDQAKLKKDLIKWVNSCSKSRTFSVHDFCPLYSEDLITSIVIKNELKANPFDACILDVLNLASVSGILRTHNL